MNELPGPVRWFILAALGFNSAIAVLGFLFGPERKLCGVTAIVLMSALLLAVRASSKRRKP